MKVTARDVVHAVSPLVMAAAVSLIVCGAFLTAIESRANEKLYRNQISSCERGQAIRTVIHEALLIAEEAMGENPVAHEFARLDGSVWPLTPCVELIERP